MLLRCPRVETSEIRPERKGAQLCSILCYHGSDRGKQPDSCRDLMMAASAPHGGSSVHTSPTSPSLGAPNPIPGPFESVLFLLPTRARYGLLLAKKKSRAEKSDCERRCRAAAVFVLQKAVQPGSTRKFKHLRVSMSLDTDNANDQSCCCLTCLGLRHQ